MGWYFQRPFQRGFLLELDRAYEWTSNFFNSAKRERTLHFLCFLRQTRARIIERLDRKLADVIGSNIVKKCDVTLSRAIQPLISDDLRVLFFLASLSLTTQIARVLKYRMKRIFSWTLKCRPLVLKHLHGDRAAAILLKTGYPSLRFPNMVKVNINEH